MARKRQTQRRDRTHVSYFSEAFERRGSWLRSVSVDVVLGYEPPHGGASLFLNFDIPAETDDPRISEVFRLAQSSAREHLRHALALVARKISEDTFKDEISRASHLAAHALLSRAIDLAEQDESWRAKHSDTR